MTANIIVSFNLTFEAKSAINYALNMGIEGKDIHLPIEAEEAGIGGFLDGLTADLERKANQTGLQAGDETLHNSMLTQKIDLIIPSGKPENKSEV